MEVGGGDGTESYKILKCQLEKRILSHPPFLDLWGSKAWLTSHEPALGILDPKNSGGCLAYVELPSPAALPRSPIPVSQEGQQIVPSASTLPL